MDSITYLKKQIKSVQNLQDSVLLGLSNETVNQIPPGKVSPIGVIWLHMVNGEDIFTSILLGQKPLWNSGGWDQRFGVEKPPNIGEDWSTFQEAELTIDLLQDYQVAVRENISACLAQTTSKTLDETVRFFSDSDPKAEVWKLLVTHSLSHTGEISALKGIFGEKGLPF
jgi:uncharacterized damage-inducible protein DinB